MPKNTTDPLEKLVAETLDRWKIIYICPDQINDSSGRPRLDFYVPSWDMYIECKAWGSSRLHKQVEEVNNCIVLIGMKATERFCMLLDYWEAKKK